MFKAIRWLRGNTAEKAVSLLHYVVRFNSMGLIVFSGLMIFALAFPLLVPNYPFPVSKSMTWYLLAPFPVLFLSGFSGLRKLYLLAIMLMLNVFAFQTMMRVQGVFYSNLQLHLVDLVFCVYFIGIWGVAMWVGRMGAKEETISARTAAPNEEEDYEEIDFFA